MNETLQVILDNIRSFLSSELDVRKIVLFIANLRMSVVSVPVTLPPSVHDWSIVVIRSFRFLFSH